MDISRTQQSGSDDYENPKVILSTVQRHCEAIANVFQNDGTFDSVFL